MNIGILGGTFNPVHNGHLIIAEQIRELFNLDRIYFVASAVPPHKEGPILQGYHRLNMIKCAIDSNPFFYCSSIEIDRGGHSYTIDTIDEMKKECGQGHTFFFIIGADAFRDITTWKEYKRLLRTCKFIVISRPGILFSTEELESSSLIKELGLRFTVLGNASLYKGYVIPHDQMDIFFALLPLIDISSTHIRELIRNGRSIRYQVPVTVEHYIRKNKLYGE